MLFLNRNVNWSHNTIIHSRYVQDETNNKSDDNQKPGQHYQHYSSNVEPQGYFGPSPGWVQEPIPVVILSLHNNHDSMHYTTEQCYM